MNSHAEVVPTVAAMRIAICFRLANFFRQHTPCKIKAFSFCEVDVLALCSLGYLSTHVPKKVADLLSQIRYFNHRHSDI